MGRLSWIIQVGPKCRGRGRFDYRRREDDAMMKAEALNMEKGATSQGIQVASGS